MLLAHEMRTCCWHMRCAHVGGVRRFQVASSLVAEVLSDSTKWIVMFDNSLGPFDLTILQRHILLTQPTQDFLESCLTRCRVVRCFDFVNFLRCVEEFLLAESHPSLFFLPGGFARFSPNSPSCKLSCPFL
eukprot:GHVS01084831.1.p1 GENE.GHVS01084831.1~~GHVS01084831.1.p1  ORF type:complete len:131 (+),score=11.52 GHVS01084831.1:96-488(+)